MPKKPSDAGQPNQPEDAEGPEYGETEYDRRPYFAVSNELVGHPKFKRLSDRAVRHLLRIWAHCNAYLTDGVVDPVTLMEFGEDLGQELIDCGFVHPMPNRADYYCHDWLKHQKSRAEIESLRSVKVSSGAAGAHERWHVKRGKHDPNCALCIESAG